jgi:hypothetical protein
MKIIVATNKTQGRRKSDIHPLYNFEGIVGYPQPCGKKHGLDAACPCRRSFMLLTSKGITTTAVVVDAPTLTAEKYAALFINVYSDEGSARAIATEFIKVAAGFNFGDVLERRGNKIQKRPVPVCPGYIPKVSDRVVVNSIKFGKISGYVVSAGRVRANVRVSTPLENGGKPFILETYCYCLEPHNHKLNAEEGA